MTIMAARVLIRSGGPCELLRRCSLIATASASNVATSTHYFQYNCCNFSSSAKSSATADASKLSHLSPDGSTPRMVDVGAKRVTQRSATARTTVRLPPAVLDELRRLGRDGSGEALAGPKGPIGATAIIAGVLGAKQTSALIPFCHPLPIEDCQVRITAPACDAIEIECTVRVTHKTGVEMEALTGASVAALCVYDMCKALSHDIVIERTRLVEKTGGKSDFRAE